MNDFNLHFRNNAGGKRTDGFAFKKQDSELSHFSDALHFKKQKTPQSKTGEDSHLLCFVVCLVLNPALESALLT